MTPRQFLTNATDSFNCVFAISSVFFDTSGDWESKSIKKDLVRWDAVFNGLTIGTLSDRKLFLGSPRHSLFINGTNNDTCTILLRQFQYLEETRFPVFVIGRVQQAFTTSNL